MPERKCLLAMGLNLFFLPLGYLYLKRPWRFLSGLLYALITYLFYSFLAWVLFPTVSGLAHFALFYGFILLITVAILTDTCRVSRAMPLTPAPRLFRRVHLVWLLPLYFTLLVLAGDFFKRPENRFTRTHSLASRGMEPSLSRGDYLFADYRIDPASVRRGDLLVVDLSRWYGEEALTNIERVVALPGDTIRLERESIRLPEGGSISVLRIVLNGEKVPLRFNLPAGEEIPVSKAFHADRKVLLYELLEGRPHAILADRPRGRGAAEEKGGRSSAAAVTSILEQYYGSEQKLKENEFFLLGDNRDDSRDSRLLGPFRLEEIVGRYMYTYFSFLTEEECNLRDSAGFLSGYLFGEESNPCRASKVRWERAGISSR